MAKQSFKDRLESRITDSVQNRRLSGWVGSIEQILNSQDKNLIKIHQHLLGKQDGTWIGSDGRYWVWDRPKYRVYIHNKIGIIVEVPIEQTNEESKASLEQYFKDLGINHSFEEIRQMTTVWWAAVDKAALDDYM